VAYEASRSAYLTGDHESAVRTLRAIVDDLERAPEGPETFRQWTRAVLRLAKDESDLGRPDAARALLDRYLRATPEGQADPDLYPARFIQQLEQARSSLRAEPTRTLRVSARDDGAAVFLNGRGVGVAPLELVVPRGRYRLAGVRDGVRVHPRLVDLQDADAELTLDFTIPMALRPALGPGLALPEDDLPGQVLAVGGYLDLSEVVLVRLRNDAGASFVVGALYDARRGMLVREGRVRASSASGLPALAEFLVTGTTPAGVELLDGKDRPVSHPTAGIVPREAPPSSHTLGWVTLGTGLAAVGLATFAAVETHSAATNYQDARDIQAAGLTTMESISAYNSAVAAGDAATRRATAGWVGAGACAVVTGVIGYLNYRRTGEFGPFRF